MRVDNQKKLLDAIAAFPTVDSIVDVIMITGKERYIANRLMAKNIEKMQGFVIKDSVAKLNEQFNERRKVLGIPQEHTLSPEKAADIEKKLNEIQKLLKG